MNNILYFITIILIFHSKSIFSQNIANENVNELMVSFGLPFGLSKETKNLIVNDFNLSKNESFSLTFEINNQTIVSSNNYMKQTIGFKLGYSTNYFSFSNNSFNYLINSHLAKSGLVYEFWLKNKWSIGSALDIGAIFSNQELFSKKDINNIYESYITNNQNTYEQKSRVSIYIGGTFKCLYKLNRKIAIFSQYSIGLADLKRTGLLEKNKLFSNFSNFSIGISYQLK